MYYTRDEGYIMLGFFQKKKYATQVFNAAMVLPALKSKLNWQHNLPIYFSLKNDHVFPKIRSKYFWIIDLGIFFLNGNCDLQKRCNTSMSSLGVLNALEN